MFLTVEMMEVHGVSSLILIYYLNNAGEYSLSQTIVTNESEIYEMTMGYNM